MIRNYDDFSKYLASIKVRPAAPENVKYFLQVLELIDLTIQYYKDKGYEIPADVYERGLRGLQRGSQVYIEKKYHLKYPIHEYVTFWIWIAIENKLGVKPEDRLTEDAEDEYQGEKAQEEQKVG